MPIGVLTTVGHRDNGSAGAYTDVTGFLVGDMSFSDETPTVPTAEAIEKYLGFAQGFEIQVHEWAKFAALNTKQISSTELDLKFTFEVSPSNVFTYKPVRFVVDPILGPLQDKAKVWIAADGVTSNPTTIPGDWTDLGPILEGSQAQTEAHFARDGLGRPLYTMTNLIWEMDFINAVAATLQSYAAVKCTLAIQHPDATYLILKNLRSRSIVNPAIGMDRLVTRHARFEVSKRDILTALTLPATPPDYFYGFRFRGRAVGYTEAGLLTIS